MASRKVSLTEPQRACHPMGTPAGFIPPNVSVRLRARVTAGLAKLVEAVKQYAETM